MPSVMETSTSFITLHESAASLSSNTSQTFFIYNYLQMVSILIIFSIEIPMICLFFSQIYQLNKSSQTTPVFMINLLIADLIQTVSAVSMIGFIDTPTKIFMFHFKNFYKSFNQDFYFLFSYILILIVICAWVCITSLYFTTSIAIERYIMIAHPIWHKFHRSVKGVLCSSLTGWLLPLIVIPLYIFLDPLSYILLFIPFPVITVCFVLVCRFLIHSTSFTPLKKRFILAPVLLVLMSYTFLILPLLVYLFVDEHLGLPAGGHFESVLEILYLLKPIMDCLLCVLMRSDAENIIWTTHCCCNPKTNQSKTQNMMITIDEQRHLNDGIDSNSSPENV